MSTRLLALSLSTIALAAGCTESTQDRLHDDWQQTILNNPQAGEWEESTKTVEEYCGCLLMSFVMIHCG